MKISKILLLVTLMALCSCDQERVDKQLPSEKSSNLNARINNEYSLNEILTGLKDWEDVRTNGQQLKDYFESGNGFAINMNNFPLGSEIHAYPCILDGVLKFALISEVYDNSTYVNNIHNYIVITDLETYDTHNIDDELYPELTYQLPTQYITATEAINRINDWNANSNSWLNSNLPIYQLFSIPTYSLTANTYKVFLGLKQNRDGIKSADLVLSHSNSFYDTVLLFPPRRFGTSVQLLDLF